jgi:hypothetical protein
MTDPSLLQPSLTADRPVDAGYSLQASFWVAFLGGGLAVAPFALLNARAWGRQRRDAPWLVLTLIAAIAFTIAVPALRASGDIPTNWWTTRFVQRAFGLLLWGAWALRYRAMHRGQQMSNEPVRKPWQAAFACIAFAVGLAVGCSFITRLFAP